MHPGPNSKSIFVKIAVVDRRLRTIAPYQSRTSPTVQVTFGASGSWKDRFQNNHKYIYILSGMQARSLSDMASKLLRLRRVSCNARQTWGEVSPVDFVWIPPFRGAVDLPWWGYMCWCCWASHVTIAAVTIFLHRAQAHHVRWTCTPSCRTSSVWLWLTTGMVTRDGWPSTANTTPSADHRGPAQPDGLRPLGRAAFLALTSTARRRRTPRTISRYGYGTPDDWMERNVYGKYTWRGMGVSLVIFARCSAFAGLAMWAIQLAWIPDHRPASSNSTGHFWGYRNLLDHDTSTNISPIGIIIGGEELHNNHHAFGASAKFAHRWYEFDIGWIYIRMMSAVRLGSYARWRRH